MFEKIFDLVKNNFKNPKLYIGILIVLLCFLVLFPYIDANFFYYQRINDRIDILHKISEIDTDAIAENPVLATEYEHILSEIEKQSYESGSFGSIFIKETNSTVNLIKFLTGAAIFWILGIVCFFIKGFKSLSNKFFVFAFFVIIGIPCGFIAKAIPTIVTPIVNYIGFPVLTIVVIALLLTREKKEDK